MRVCTYQVVRWNHMMISVVCQIMSVNKETSRKASKPKTNKHQTGSCVYEDIMKITCYSFQISWIFEAGLHSHNFLKACWYGIHYTFITNYIFSYPHSRVRERRHNVLILNWQSIVRCWKELLMFWENYCLCYSVIVYSLISSDVMLCTFVDRYQHFGGTVQEWPWWWRQQAIRYVDTCLLNCVVSLPRTL
jgi:hypothetical protein